MKRSLTSVILTAVIFVAALSGVSLANMATETSMDNTNTLIAWADENQEDSPELAAKVRELEKKWGTTSNNIYENFSENNSSVKTVKTQGSDLDARLQAIDKYWAKKAQSEKDEADRLSKLAKKEKEQREYEEALEKRLKEIDARYANI